MIQGYYRVIFMTFIMLIAIGFVTWFWFAQRVVPNADEMETLRSVQDEIVQKTQILPTPTPTPTAIPVPSNEDAQATLIPEEAMMQSVFQKVPFTSQAPFGEWDNLMFQDGCEEASMIMVMAWMQGTSLTLEKGKSDIESITQFETKKFGTFIADTSVEDTAQILRDYYHYDKVFVLHNVSINDIKNLLSENALVMAPMNGQALHNPNFTQPGPLHHMLVITGYDVKTHEFVTNDPGTKKGESYRYDEDVLYGAIRDYPTGNDEPLAMDNQKTIIVVKK